MSADESDKSDDNENNSPIHEEAPNPEKSAPAATDLAKAMSMKKMLKKAETKSKTGKKGSGKGKKGRRNYNRDE